MSHEMDGIKSFQPVVIKPVVNGYQVQHKVNLVFSHYDEMCEYLYRLWHTDASFKDEQIDDTTYDGRHE